MCPPSRTAVSLNITPFSCAHVLEAQMRGSLHAHILCWFERRDPIQGYRPIDPVRRRLPGTEHRQRPQSQKVEALTNYQEDHVYHAAKVGRVTTEMVRPSVKGIVDRRRYGGWDYERLRIAGLARCIQTKWLHSCTTKYCLQNRSFDAPFVFSMLRASGVKPRPLVLGACGRQKVHRQVLMSVLLPLAFRLYSSLHLYSSSDRFSTSLS